MTLSPYLSAEEDQQASVHDEDEQSEDPDHEKDT